jgi:hypothetical protein
MHQLNVLILGSNCFTSTLIELKPFLKFNPYLNSSLAKYDIIMFNEDALKNDNNKAIINKTKSLKIFVHNKIDRTSNYDSFLQVPTTVSEINSIVENVFAKKTFNENSSILIKNYTLNKNEKKLIKDKSFIILTEKEIQLLELLFKQKKSISKSRILSTVWSYSPEVDTHTVETHIYRLRKKINDKFSDENFISNNKNGYYL